jgi:hypothetical protein
MEHAVALVGQQLVPQQVQTGLPRFDLLRKERRARIDARALALDPIDPWPDMARHAGWMQQSAVPRCAILSVGSTGGIGW